MGAIHPIVKQMKEINKYSFADLETKTGVPEARIRRALNGRIQLPAVEMTKIETEWRKILSRGYV